MKRVFSVFLSFILIFNLVFISFSYADIISDLNEVEIGTEVNIDKTPLDTGDGPDIASQNASGGGYQPSGWFAQFLSWITTFISQAIMSVVSIIIVSLPTIDSCIFNKGAFFNLSFFDAVPTGLSGSLQGSISAIYNAFRYLVTAIYIVVLVYLAIRMMFSSIGRQKAHYKELFKHWLVGLLLLFSFHWVMAFIIWLSNAFVGILANLSDGILTSGLDTVKSMAEELFALEYSNLPFTAFIVSRLATSTSVLGPLNLLLGGLMPIVTLVLSLFLLGSTFSIIITYFKRLVTIAVLILVFPLVALSYVFDKIGDRKAQTLGIWLKEFVVNVTIQPIHALILVLISLLFSTGIGDPIPDTIVSTNLFGPHLVGAVMTILSLRLIPMGEELLKKLFQISSSMGPGADGISGSMAKAGLAIQGAKNMAGSLSKLGKGASGLVKLHKQGNDLLKDHNIKPSRGILRNLNQQRNLLKSNEDAREQFEKYKKEAVKQAGTKSLQGAYAKTLSQLSAATLGAGTAVTGAGAGKFLAEASSRAALGSEIVGGISSLAKSFSSLNGDAKKAEDFEKKAKVLESMSKEEIDKLDEGAKKKIAAELGISVEQVNSNNKDLLISDYKSVGNAAKWGIEKDDLHKFSRLHNRQKNIEQGLTPDGKENLDYSKVSNWRQSKHATWGDIDGITYKIKDIGNSSLKDNEMVAYNPDYRKATNKDLAQQNSHYQDLIREKSDLEKNIETQKLIRNSATTDAERELATKTIKKLDEQLVKTNVEIIKTENASRINQEILERTINPSAVTSASIVKEANLDDWDNNMAYLGDSAQNVFSGIDNNSTTVEQSANIQPQRISNVETATQEFVVHDNEPISRQVVTSQPQTSPQRTTVVNNSETVSQAQQVLNDDDTSYAEQWLGNEAANVFGNTSQSSINNTRIMQNYEDIPEEKRFIFGASLPDKLIELDKDAEIEIRVKDNRVSSTYFTGDIALVDTKFIDKDEIVHLKKVDEAGQIWRIL